jgi:hypothetical protein
MTDKIDPFADRDEFFDALAGELEEFLLRLVASPDDLLDFVNNRVAFLDRAGLSPEARALLLESNFSRIQSVMERRGSPAIRWICIWIF